MTDSRSKDHFRRIYAAKPDPWGFASSAYEQAKYRQTLAALAGRRFRSGLEVGCSIGVLTRMLAEQCDQMLGIDLLEEPLQAARARCADLPSVSFAEMRVPDEWPDHHYDLIVLSEVLYFLTQADIARCADHVRRTTAPHATIALVNWLGHSDDPCTGDEAVDAFMAASLAWLRPERQQRESGYRIDVLERISP